MKYYILICAGISAMLASCGGGGNSAAEDKQIVEIEQAAESFSGTRGEMQIDSLALMADDLTPAEASQVLLTYMRIREDARKAGNEKRELETMRKFVDVYDIVLGANGADMRETFERIARHNPHHNFEAAAKEYRELLSNYASGSGVEESGYYEPQPAAADSSSTEEVKAEDAQITGEAVSED